MGGPTQLSEFPVLSSRKHPRSPCKIPAMIFVSRELPPIKCTVIDISDGGAGISLWVGSTFGIPDKFELQIEGERERRPCRVAWMKPHTLGVEFVTPNY
jgi:hypothetical protein